MIALLTDCPSWHVERFIVKRYFITSNPYGMIWRVFMKLPNRLPAFDQILAVYAVAAFMLFAWSLLWFFWNVPSWLHFMNLGVLFATLSYAMAASFLEGLTFLGLLLIVAFLLPPAWFRDHFTARGAAVTVSLLGLIMLRDYWIVSENYLLKPMTTFGVVLVALMAFLLFLTVKFSWMAKALSTLADRLTIFLYLFVPISIISILNVLLRNLLP